MPRNGMTIHYSGMTLESQKRIEDGVKDILNRFFNNEPFQDKDVIVSSGKFQAQAILLNNSTLIRLIRFLKTFIQITQLFKS